MKLLHSQVSRHEAFQDSRITFEGAPNQISPAAGQVLSMALHELSTNAAKFGARSNYHGTVHVAWDTSGGAAPRFRIKWLEQGGPPPAPPERRGFGTLVLTKMAEAELDAEIVLEFPSSGLFWELSAPAHLVLAREPFSGA